MQFVNLGFTYVQVSCTTLLCCASTESEVARAKSNVSLFPTAVIYTLCRRVLEAFLAISLVS
jgi:hypothetical protein